MAIMAECTLILAWRFVTSGADTEMAIYSQRKIEDCLTRMLADMKGWYCRENTQLSPMCAT